MREHGAKRTFRCHALHAVDGEGCGEEGVEEYVE